MTQTCICNEGTIHFPDNALCQTINIVSLASGQAVNISRDRPADGETFEQYLQGQLKILQSKCGNYKQISLQHPDPTAVFSKIAKLTFSFKPAEGVTYWQYIVLAERSPGNIMLFTSMFNDRSTLDQGSGEVDKLFKGFRPH
ncbi:DcrB-related protein [Intestinirhabdus alba]|jgi:hypothetical protein|uniref:DUF1795 domain-containing protein n=1 Tax=Intestinirhabdus alba TaxID=2899544 RepID=A0A6L6IIF1_9ENTR|nr:DcrB-related protein [Intestinirhabdus alba]MTH45704.1 DUF1795 domain-containing protein [Intestinirhabdus alba]